MKENEFQIKAPGDKEFKTIKCVDVEEYAQINWVCQIVNGNTITLYSPIEGNFQFDTDKPEFFKEGHSYQTKRISKDVQFKKNVLWI